MHQPSNSSAVSRSAEWLARATALLGGSVLVIVTLITTLSIIGRELSKLGHWLSEGALAPIGTLLLASGVDEIKGSYEITEVGIAFAIFTFLPICQLHGAHATVDVFTAPLRGRAQLIILTLWELTLSGATWLIGWRLYGGMTRYLGNGETTLFLQFPVWWGYAMALAACIVAAIIALYCSGFRIAELVTHRSATEAHS